ncbi:hypothetical protein VT03_27945 [Planctomyces sp. SH-PL14]|nr:hypothetical protein VT03_27945 [Planctomyces sp. SH-PL14]
MEVQVNRLAINVYLRQGILPPSDLMESASLWQGFLADQIRQKHQFTPGGRRRRNMTDARIRAITEKEWRERSGLGEVTRENGRRYRAGRGDRKTNIQRERFFADIAEHLTPQRRLPSIARVRDSEQLEERGWRREQDDPDAPGLHFVSDRW